MRFLITATVLVVIVQVAHAQNIFQMNAAVQNQFNAAQQSAWPVYPPAYPRHMAPHRATFRFDYYGGDFYRQGMLLEQQDQTRQLRRMNRTLQMMEWDLQDAARRR